MNSPLNLGTPMGIAIIELDSQFWVSQQRHFGGRVHKEEGYDMIAGPGLKPA